MSLVDSLMNALTGRSTYKPRHGYGTQRTRHARSNYGSRTPARAKVTGRQRFGSSGGSGSSSYAWPIKAGFPAKPLKVPVMGQRKGGKGYGGLFR